MMEEVTDLIIMILTIIMTIRILCIVMVTNLGMMTDFT